jgi:energy-coupling factor transporter ATP-binding protein EcfA2
MGEPVLLTGETGTGKTSIITHLAVLLHRPLTSVNLSQQTESSDLLGSFKPIDARVPGSELQLQFLDLFRSTFSQKRNIKFEESTWKAVKEGKWKRASGLWKESVRLAKDRIRSKLSEATSRCVHTLILVGKELTVPEETVQKFLIPIPLGNAGKRMKFTSGSQRGAGQHSSGKSYSLRPNTSRKRGNLHLALWKGHWSER